MALATFCSPAEAQARCPESEKLRSEAAEIAKGMIGVATSARCDAYNHFSITWGRIVRYASDHRESCDISSVSLTQLENRHREAVKARDAICTSRPLQPFPPDIVRH
jgi:hypothetical protein